MFEPKRLHPISALINFVKGLKDAILPLIAVFFLNNNRGDGLLGSLPLIILSSLLLFILLSGIFRWLRFTYRVEEGELRIEHGMFLRKKRYIPIDRIQSLDFSEGIFHRPFQLVKVTVETAGSSASTEAEAELTAIHKEEAKQLELLLDEQKGQEVVGDDEENVESSRKLVYQMTRKEIILMALTSGGAGVVISGVLVFLSQGMEFLPIGAIYDEVINWLQIGLLIVAVAVLVVLFLAYGISVLLTIFRYNNFSVYLDSGDLIMTRGLLEKKQVTIPLNRIQGLRIDENLIRQPLGLATVTIISAGGSVNSDAEHTLRILPLIKRAEVQRVLQSILGEYQLDEPLNRPPRRALFRYLMRFNSLPLIVATIVSIYFYPLGLLSLLLIPLFSLLGYLAYKDAGWNLLDNQLTFIHRFIIKQTFVMKKYRIQSFRKDQTLLQTRKNLASVEATMKSGVGGAAARVLYLEEKDTETIMEWYRHKQ